MKIKRFEDVIAWQKAQYLAVEMYHIFGRLQDFSFKNQILRAVVSVSNNIAEGFERKSNKEFSQFLYVALASASEVKSMLYLAERLEYVSPEQRNKYLEHCSEVSRLIRGFINSLQ